MTVKINGELEIDIARGVVYFHTTDHPRPEWRTITPLRIQGLHIPRDFHAGRDQIDINASPLKITYGTQS